MSKITVSSKGKRVDFAKLKADNPKTRPVGRLPKKKIVNAPTVVNSVSQPPKVRATVPSKQAVTKVEPAKTQASAKKNKGEKTNVD